MQMKQNKNVNNNEMRFIGPRSHLEEEHPVDMVSLNLTNRARKEAGPLGGLRDQACGFSCDFLFFFDLYEKPFANYTDVLKFFNFSIF